MHLLIVSALLLLFSIQNHEQNKKSLSTAENIEYHKSFPPFCGQRSQPSVTKKFVQLLTVATLILLFSIQNHEQNKKGLSTAEDIEDHKSFPPLCGQRSQPSVTKKFVQLLTVASLILLFSIQNHEQNKKNVSTAENIEDHRTLPPFCGQVTIV